MNNKDISVILKRLGEVKNRKLLKELYLSQDLPYHGLDYIQDGQNISDNIKKMVSDGIIDYDEYSGSLSLEYQTDDYFSYLMKESNSTNIEEVQKKIGLIKNKFNHIRLRKEDNQVIVDVTQLRESRDIQKAIRSFPSIINKNYIALSNTSVFAYKTQENIKIKIEILEDCKSKLKELSGAIDKIERFLKKNNKALVEVLPNPLLLDRIRDKIILSRKTMLHGREIISSYLAKTLEDGNFLKKLNKISLYIQENQLSNKSDFSEVCNSFPIVIESQHYVKKIDVGIGDFIDVIADKYLENIKKEQIKLSPKEKKAYTPINKKKKNIEINLVNALDLYNLFKKDTEYDNLVDLIYSKNLGISKTNSLLSIFIIKWHKELHIEKRNTIIRNGYIYPRITKKY